MDTKYYRTFKYVYGGGKTPLTQIYKEVDGKNLWFLNVGYESWEINVGYESWEMSEYRNFEDLVLTNLKPPNYYEELTESEVNSYLMLHELNK